MKEFDLKMLASNPYFAHLGIEYIGQQERLNDFPLDAFNDLETGSTYLRRPMESVEDMAKRIKQTHIGRIADIPERCSA